MGLNDQQKDIVRRLDEPLFVAAGAGSGKTFTLTQRILHALTPGSAPDGGRYLDSLSQVLVITFTQAAAREIKERTRAVLRAAGPDFRDFTLEVDSAWISTIHGMCSRILHRHALDLGLDPEFRVASANEEAALRTQALEDVVGRALKQAEEGSPLAQAFSTYGYGKMGPYGYGGVLGIVEALRGAAAATPGGYRSLRIPSPDLGGALGRLADALAGYVARLSAKGRPSASEKAARERAQASVEGIDGFLRLPAGERTAEAAGELLRAVRLPPRGAADVKESLDTAKLALAEAKAEARLAGTQPLAAALRDLAEEVDARYGQLKLEASVLDNDDLIAKAAEALRREDIRRQYAGRFRLVMVDEFQDTDQRQLELISALAGEDARHLCTVGDAQQSIYRFRGADVSVFRGRGEALGREHHIEMSENYRSDDAVLRLVDRVCDAREGGVLRGFMSLSTGRSADQGSYVAKGVERLSVELVEGGTADSRSPVMAAAVAERLSAYAAAGQSPGGMALLLGSMRRAGLYVDALRERGLDCVITGGSTFTGLAEVKVMAALLHTLANWKDTKNGLFPLLESPMFGLDADDFAGLGTQRQERLEGAARRPVDEGLDTFDLLPGIEPSPRAVRAHEVLTRARDLLATRPVADVCGWVVRESGWLGRLEQGGVKGRAAEANVVAALGYIRQLTDEMGLGPTRAARELDVWLETAKVPPATLSGGSGGAVRVMTVHASKGLEFPVVAVAECWSDPPDRGSVKAGRDLDPSNPGGRVVVLEPKAWREPKARGEGEREVRLGEVLDTAQGLRERLGLDPVPERPEGLCEWDLAVREQNRTESYEERTRLLYVALTRAEEALVVGLPMGRPSKRPTLADATLDALFHGQVPGVGETVVPLVRRTGHDGDAAGEDGWHRVHVRHVALQAKEVVKGTTYDVSVESGGTLQMGDGTLTCDARELAALAVRGARRLDGTAGEGDEPPQAVGGAGPDDAGTPRGRFALFERQPDDLARLTTLWQPGEGVFSFSSVERGAAPEEAPEPAATEATDTDEGPDALPAGDRDRAQALGSAFHGLAQAMVDARADLPEGRIAAAERFWGLSQAERARLGACLRRWSGSRVRQEALSHALVRAEVPLFVRAEGPYGEYLRGYIDLLATDPGSPHALLIDYKTGDRGLTAEEVRARHGMQASFYASALMGQGFSSVTCKFVCVEREDPEVPGEPYVVRYEFDDAHPPRV